MNHENKIEEIKQHRRFAFPNTDFQICFLVEYTKLVRIKITLPQLDQAVDLPLIYKACS